MSRDIRQTTARQDREQQRINRELGRVLITACPDSIYGKRRQTETSETERLLAALVRQDRLVAVHTFSRELQSRIGAVYLGKVKKIVKNLNACFVEIAGQEQCFLHMGQGEASPFLTNRAYDGRLLEGDEVLVQIQQEAIKIGRAHV